MRKSPARCAVLQCRRLSDLPALLSSDLAERLCRLFLAARRRRVRAALHIGAAGAALLGEAIVAVRLGLIAAASCASLAVGLLVVGIPACKRLRQAQLAGQARARLKQVAALYGGGTFVHWSDWVADERTRQAIQQAVRAYPASEIVLGRIDNDGRVLSTYGSLPGFTPVGEDEFVPRYRFPLDIVLLDGKVLIRQDLRGNRDRFLREWRALTRLHRKANVPALYKVDERRCLLYRSLVSGPTVRDLLVQRGARILSVQTGGDPDLENLDQSSRIQAVWARGRARLPDCLPPGFLDELEQQMDIIHGCGVCGFSLTFGNVVLDPNNGAPYFVDFEGAHTHASTSSPAFRMQRDRDRTTFARVYGRDLLTETSAPAACRRVAAASVRSSHLAAAEDGLPSADSWPIGTVPACGHFSNAGAVAPLVRDSRVLDLGANRGVIPMMMLRTGAREVVDVEPSPTLVEDVQAVRRVFEWRDMRKYALQVCHCQMPDIMHADWGAFDVVTVFCWPSRLAQGDMERVVRRAAQLAPVMVVQVGAWQGVTDGGSRESRVDSVRGILQRNGFSHVQVFAPRRCPRPLLVGRRNERPGRPGGARA